MGRRAPRAFLRSGQKNARRGSDNRNAARRVSAIPAPPAACRREQRARPCCASRRPAAATGLAQCSGATLFKGREKENFKGLWSAGKNLRLPGRPVLPFPLPAEAGPDKVFWRGGGARGGGRTFCPQKGGLPLAPILSAYCGRSSTRREMASATWAGAMASLPSRSAMVRARRSTRV